MERKRYAREFKLEAVRLVKERGVSVAEVELPPFNRTQGYCD